MTVVVNHLKSKGSDCNCVGDPDTGDGQGNCNVTRTAAAAALVDWLATDPTGSGDPDVLLIGDMNSYTFEDPITTLRRRRLHEPRAASSTASTSYSYVFNGESGYLDHALATGVARGQVTGVADWHINPDEPTVLDYNVEFKSANQVNTFYDPGPYRVVGPRPGRHRRSTSNSAPTRRRGRPVHRGRGRQRQRHRDRLDRTADTLTYAWDLDNDGAFETRPARPRPSRRRPSTGRPRGRSAVQVSDGEETAVDEATVTVTNVAPTVTFTAPATVFAGFPFTLSLTGATDPAPADVLTYAFDCGDGSGYGAFGAATSRSCPTTFVGTRSVGGKIRDDDGGVTEYHATVSVIVTFDSLCALTTQYSSKANVAKKLCEELEKAKREAEKDKKKNPHIDHYIHEVEKESGKAFTSEEASILIALAREL